MHTTFRKNQTTVSRAPNFLRYILAKSVNIYRYLLLRTMKINITYELTNWIRGRKAREIRSSSSCSSCLLSEQQRGIQMSACRYAYQCIISYKIYLQKLLNFWLRKSDHFSKHACVETTNRTKGKMPRATAAFARQKAVGKRSLAIFYPNFFQEAFELPCFF